ncbi:MAG: elongation factor P [Candidatus Cloacimonetes bacterium 4572_65]|nr:MAG: elongation factor P [Candidatus Cloacimonetes bacterium 4572_65]
MASTSDIRNGMIIEWKHGLYEFIEFLHVKPGKGAAFVRSKLRNIKTGQVVDNTFRTNVHFNEVRIEKSKKEYLYRDGDFYVLMDLDNYEMMSVPMDSLEKYSKFLKENMQITIKTTPENDVIGVELPVSVVQEITECEPNIKGNTASGSGKVAYTETGLRVMVPFFVEQGEKIRIDTRTGDYLERA